MTFSFPHKFCNATAKDSRHKNAINNSPPLIIYECSARYSLSYNSTHTFFLFTQQLFHFCLHINIKKFVLRVFVFVRKNMKIYFSNRATPGLVSHLIATYEKLIERENDFRLEWESPSELFIGSWWNFRWRKSGNPKTLWILFELQL